MVDSNFKFKDFEQITETNKMATTATLDQQHYRCFNFTRKIYNSEIHWSKEIKKIDSTKSD